MRDFITCLEFLTRVRFSKRTDWRDEDFSRSVPYFPLVGLVIGSLLAAVNYSLFYIETPLFLRRSLRHGLLRKRYAVFGSGGQGRGTGEVQEPPVGGDHRHGEERGQ